MKRSLALHVGTPKSGTTHLQAILAAGRGQLAGSGILYPGAGYLPRNGFNQQPAVYALAGRSIGWADGEVRLRAIEYLDRLCEEAAACQGRALISAESLAFFEEAEARSLLDRLGYDPSRVTVVITARDLGRILPSIWQQNVKNGSVEALGPYLDAVASLRDRPGVSLWTAFGLPALVGRWSRIVGADRVVLVTSPHRRSGTDVLWQRFAAAMDVPTALADAVGAQERADDNLSLTGSQAELVRRLNVVLQADGYGRDRQRHLRARLLRIWMNLPPTAGQRPAVPEHLHDTVRSWARQDAERLDQLGIRVVGSLADLEPVFPAQPAASEFALIDVDMARDVLALVEQGFTEPRGERPVRWPSRLTSSISRRLHRLRTRAGTGTVPPAAPVPAVASGNREGVPIDLSPLTDATTTTSGRTLS